MVTYTLIGLNVIVFILELLTGDPIMGNGSGAVARLLAYYPGDILVAPWALITNAFVHANLIHILLNMWSLFILGVPLERYLGRGRFIVLYLIGILGADVGVDFLSNFPVIGASGAIFALLGALILFARRLGFSPTWLIILGVANLAYGFIEAGISWQDHVGGLVAGLLVAGLLLGTRMRSRQSLQVGGLIALPALFLLALFLHATV